MFGTKQITGKEPDEQLMLLVSKGERKAFELLYDRYFDKLVWFAQSFTNDLHKAEDAIQEVFIKIIEAPEQYDRNKKFSTWIYTLAGNACKNLLRNEQNRSRLLEENRPQSSSHTDDKQLSLDHKFLQQRIRSAYAGLNEKEKQLFVLRFEHDLSLKEIAAVINIPEGSVKSGIYYLLKKMSHSLKDFTHGK